MENKKLIDFVPGTKFQLMNDVNVPDRKDGYYVVKGFSFPKGLVFSVISLNMSLQSRRMIIRVLRHQKLIDKVYTPAGIPEAAYRVFKSWKGEYSKDDIVTHRLVGKDLTAFMEIAELKEFGEEYAELTKLEKYEG
jgi:hypothetical protein